MGKQICNDDKQTATGRKNIWGELIGVGRRDECVLLAFLVHVRVVLYHVGFVLRRNGTVILVSEVFEPSDVAEHPYFPAVAPSCLIRVMEHTVDEAG